ncbi:hypothetical protein CVT26_015458 [Gymnopilus dilepis]|uniref:Uncharacterized protein n=1 Tax=Gymnopilus dilepis TaxID=231916 RepID=A0A409W4E3_9AGAR|nr:hypothetical protein CVT26_015458 [Gymnopilus dilepis]
MPKKSMTSPTVARTNPATKKWSRKPNNSRVLAERRTRAVWRRSGNMERVGAIWRRATASLDQYSRELKDKIEGTRRH